MKTLLYRKTGYTAIEYNGMSREFCDGRETLAVAQGLKIIITVNRHRGRDVVYAVTNLVARSVSQ